MDPFGILRLHRSRVAVAALSRHFPRQVTTTGMSAVTRTRSTTRPETRGGRMHMNKLRIPTATIPRIYSHDQPPRDDLIVRAPRPDARAEGASWGGT